MAASAQASAGLKCGILNQCNRIDDSLRAFDAAADGIRCTEDVDPVATYFLLSMVLEQLHQQATELKEMVDLL